MDGKITDEDRKRDLTNMLSQKGSVCVHKFLQCLRLTEKVGGHSELIELVEDALDREISDMNIPAAKRIRLSSGMHVFYYFV